MDDNHKQPDDEKKVRFRMNILSSSKGNNLWNLIVTVISFLLSVSMTYVSYRILKNAHVVIAFNIVFLIIVVSIIFDTIGTAVTAADEAPFHAMASRKLYGAKQAIALVRNADKVSNFCNDVIGDICGVISGTATTYILITIIKDGSSPETSIAGLAATGLVAAMTVGGKAVGKTIAISNSNYIVYKAAVVIKFITARLNIKVFGLKKSSKRNGDAKKQKKEQK
ncbi:hypothetical protein DFR58_10932 [Anaerobacterium chartisolvens]|uniref:Mg2+ and Co2+ transporter CorB n=1 Tax=Anaerobacterium chartisolvens TaxID=1297424 RepID=A0A369B8D0_9FIRM|nr:Mg2+ and Co2+ transporter CorB [Anaerobacterium chartisolvens]RCX16806.1 hypothetical protein DFR58_10932 [Anaerobacterium chartisolvens]